MEFDNFKEFWENAFGSTSQDSSFVPFSCTTTTATTGTTFRSQYQLLTDAWLGQNFSLMFKYPQRIVNKDYVLKTMDQHYENVCTGKLNSITDWFQLLILIYGCRDNFPKEYQELLLKTEKRFYNSSSSTDMLDHVGKSLQIYFHIIRAHYKAENNDFEAADSIFDSLCENWMLVEEKQTNILYHSFIHYVCTAQWKKAIFTARRMWSILKIMNNSDRYNWGAMDDWIMINVVQWFILQYVSDYAKFVSVEESVEITSLLGNKKTLLLNHITPEIIADIIKPYYYTKLRSIVTNLPEIGTEK